MNSWTKSTFMTYDLKPSFFILKDAPRPNKIGTLATTVSGKRCQPGVSDTEAMVLAFTLLSVHKDMFLNLPNTNIILFLSI